MSKHFTFRKLFFINRVSYIVFIQIYFTHQLICLQEKSPQHFSDNFSAIWVFSCNYRPQQSCGKVMFLHLSVILFTGGGLLHNRPGQTPPRQIPWANTSPGQTLPGQTPPSRHPPAQCMLRYTPSPLPSACWDTHPLPGPCLDTHPPV